MLRATGGTRTLDLPEGYRAFRLDGAVLVAAAGAAERARRAVAEGGTLFGHAAAHPDARVLRGRGRLYSIPGPDGRWVVRHYRRGGAMARLLDDRYLRLGTPRPLRELRASRALRARDIATPEVLAAAVYPAGAFYRADLATREVPDSRDLAEAAFGPDPLAPLERAAAWRAAGRLVRELHDAGVIHPDLNLKNILLEWTIRPPRPHVLDLDRCRVVDRLPGWRRRRMLRRLARSRAKWEDATGRTVPGAERAAFEEGYAHGS